MILEPKACKWCKHCLVKKGLSGKIYFCKKQEQKTGVLVSMYAKTKPTSVCNDWEHFINNKEEE